MTLLQRIKNLWSLSEFQPMEIKRKTQMGDIIAPLIAPADKPHRLAQVITKSLVKNAADEFNNS